MNENEVFYCVGMRGHELVKRVLRDCKTEDYARRLFTAMTGCDYIIHCFVPTVSTLVFYIYELESETNRRIHAAVMETIDQWTATLKPRLLPIKRAKRKYTRRKK